MAEKKSKLVEIKTKPTSANVEDFIKMILAAREENYRSKDAFFKLRRSF